MTKVGLGDLIDHIASELSAAEKRARAREGHVMQFDECELEMAIEIETGAGGGVKVWVFELSGDRKKTDSNTITVRFKAVPGGEKLVFGVGAEEQEEQEEQ